MASHFRDRYAPCRGDMDRIRHLITKGRLRIPYPLTWLDERLRVRKSFTGESLTAFQRSLGLLLVGPRDDDSAARDHRRQHAGNALAHLEKIHFYHYDAWRLLADHLGPDLDLPGQWYMLIQYMQHCLHNDIVLAARMDSLVEDYGGHDQRGGPGSADMADVDDDIWTRVRGWQEALRSSEMALTRMAQKILDEATIKKAKTYCGDERIREMSTYMAQWHGVGGLDVPDVYLTSPFSSCVAKHLYPPTDTPVLPCASPRVQIQIQPAVQQLLEGPLGNWGRNASQQPDIMASVTPVAPVSPVTPPTVPDSVTHAPEWGHADSAPTRPEDSSGNRMKASAATDQPRPLVTGERTYPSIKEYARPSPKL